MMATRLGAIPITIPARVVMDWTGTVATRQSTLLQVRTCNISQTGNSQTLSSTVSPELVCQVFASFHQSRLRRWCSTCGYYREKGKCRLFREILNAAKRFSLAKAGAQIAIRFPDRVVFWDLI